MNEIKAKEIVDYTFKDIFGIDNPFSLKEIEERFAFDIDLPNKVKDSFTGKYTWARFDKHDKFVSKETMLELAKKNYWAKSKKQIKSMDDLIKYWSEIDYTIGERNNDSKEVSESDLIYESSNIFRSMRVYGSQNIIFSNDISNSKYIIAGFDDITCTSGIRVFYNIFCSSSFAVSWSKKISKCMFVTGSVDLHECMFCANLASKKYCIANMQFTK
jgi:hypothetical protein